MNKKIDKYTLEFISATVKDQSISYKTPINLNMTNFENNLVSFNEEYRNYFSLNSFPEIILKNEKFLNDDVFFLRFIHKFDKRLALLLKSAVTDEDKLIAIEVIESILELIFNFNITKKNSGFLLHLIFLNLNDNNHNSIYLDFYKKMSEKYKEYNQFYLHLYK